MAWVDGSISWFKGYYSSTDWIYSKNCYCDPVWLYFDVPACAGQASSRTIYVYLPVLYTKSITSSYEAWLYADGSYIGYTSGSKSLSVNTSTLTLTFSGVTTPTYAFTASVYLDFGYGTVQLYSSSWWPTWGMSYTAITKCGAPSSITCTNSGNSRLKPGTTYTVSWAAGSAGVSNSISAYDIAYKYSGDSDWVYPSDVTSTSFGFTPDTSHRGQTVQFAARTLGSAGSNYYSGWAYSGNYTINSLPDTPSILVSDDYVSCDKGGTITFTAAAGSDANGDSCTVYYNTSNSHSGETLYSGALNPKITTQTTYYFWTWDGYEYSPVVSKTIYVNTPPTFTSLGIKYTSYTGNASRTYIKAISTDPEVSKDVIAYQWTLNYGTETSLGSSDVISTSRMLSNYSLLRYKGNYVSLTLRIYDGYDYRYSTSGTFFVPEDPSAPTDFAAYAKDYNNSTNDKYSNTTILVEWVPPKLGDTQLKFSKSTVYITNSKTGVVTTYDYNGTENVKQIETITLPTSIGYGQGYTVSVAVQDVSGTLTYSSLQGITRISQPGFTGTTITASPDILWPYSGRSGSLRSEDIPGGDTTTSSFTVTHNRGANSEYDTRYVVTATYNGITTTLSDLDKDEGTVETTDDIVTHTYSNATWKSLFGDGASFYSPCTATISVTVINKFNDASNALTKTITLNFNEPIYWSSSTSTLTEKIKYKDIEGASLTSSNTSGSSTAILANAGEQVVLTMPSVEDINGKTLTYFIERGELSSWSGTRETIAAVASWIPRGNTISTTFPDTIEDLDSDTYYVYRVYVKSINGFSTLDDHVKSDYRYAYSPVAVRACRSRNPLLSINTASVSDGKFLINQTTTLQASTDYSSYKNWERDAINGVDSAKSTMYTMETCTDGTFASGTGGYTKLDILDESTFYSNLSGTRVFPEDDSVSFDEDTQYFVRLTVKINTGFGEIKEALSPVYVYYPNMPTVAHRSHWVGINDNSFPDSEVAGIKTTSSKNLLRLEGTNSSNKVTQLYIDLNNSQLYCSVGGAVSNGKITFGASPLINYFNMKNSNLTTCKLTTCTAATSFKGTSAGVTLDNFSIDGGSW